MREIKFRIWDKENNCWFKVDSFNLLGEAVWGGLLAEINFLKVDNYVIQQYTGLKDKNGKEIYEGDIIEAYNESENETFSGNVIYDQKLASFVFVNKGNTYYLTSFDLQVVGNIFKNPKSLKNMKYKIVFGKDLKVGDVIIDDYAKAEILEVAKGVGMGSLDFVGMGMESFDNGEYMHIKLVKRRKFCFSKAEKKITFPECPIIKLEED